MSINKGMDKEDMVMCTHTHTHTHTLSLEYYSAIKKHDYNAICSNMEWPRDYHTKWLVRQRKTNIIWYRLHVESKLWHNKLSTNRNRIIKYGPLKKSAYHSVRYKWNSSKIFFPKYVVTHMLSTDKVHFMCVSIYT